jgi:hypothetical protein
MCPQNFDGQAIITDAEADACQADETSMSIYVGNLAKR